MSSDSSTENSLPNVTTETNLVESTDERPTKTYSNKCLQIIFNRQLLRHACFFALVYFIQGITDIATGFVNLPLQTILKDQLRLSPTQTGTFFFSCTITWSIKPLYGLLSDFLPLCGYHRYSYLLITTMINLVAWISLYLVKISYASLLSLCVLAAFSLAFNDVLIDALMISVGRNFGVIATFQGIQQTATKLAATISQIPAGLLASSSVRSSNSSSENVLNIPQDFDSTKTIFLVAAICPIVLFFATMFSVEERRRKLNRNNFSQTWSSLRAIFLMKTFWFVTIFIFLFSSSPQVKTSLFYYQRDTLKFDPFFVSILNTVYSGCGIVSAILYLTIFSHFPTRRVLRIAMILKIFSLFSYNFLRDRWTSIAVAIFTGLTSEITNLSIFNLAAKSCPRNVEGTLFALFVSCVNFGGALGDWVGSMIFENFSFRILIFSAIIWVVGTIFATLFLHENGMKSTFDDGKHDEDKYHYCDVTVDKSDKVRMKREKVSFELSQIET